MKKLMLCLPLVAALAACDSTQTGLVGGAALGAALDDDDPARGAVVGALVGGTAGALLQRNQDGSCLYRNTNTGETYRAACP